MRTARLPSTTMTSPARAGAAAISTAASAGRMIRWIRPIT
jgi:hypothetical protein